MFFSHSLLLLPQDLLLHSVTVFLLLHRHLTFFLPPCRLGYTPSEPPPKITPYFTPPPKTTPNPNLIHHRRCLLLYALPQPPLVLRLTLERVAGGGETPPAPNQRQDGGDRALAWPHGGAR